MSQPVLSEIVSGPDRRLLIPGCRVCPFARVATWDAGLQVCTAVVYLDGKQARELAGDDLPPVAPDFCPLRAGGVDLRVVEAGQPEG